MKEIAITGIGTVSSLGLDFNDYVCNYKSSKTIEFTDIDIDKCCESISSRRNDRFTKFGLAAFKNLMEQSKYFEITPDERGVIANTYFGPVNTVGEFLQTAIFDGMEQASPTLFSNTVINAGLGKISVEYKLKGISYMLCGTNPLYYSIQDLREKRSQVVFAGGLDDVRNQAAYRGNSERVYHESAAFLGLELEEEAVGRDADILAYIHGIGVANTLHDFDKKELLEEDILFAMQKAIKDSGLEANQIERVYAFSNDISSESNAIKKIFPYQFISYSRMDFSPFLSAGEFFRLIDAVIDLKIKKIITPSVINLKALNSIISLVISQRKSTL